MRPSTYIITLLFTAALSLATLEGEAASDPSAPGQPSAATDSAADPRALDFRQRPHGSGYHPHDRLRPEQLLKAALQHQAEGRPQQALEELDRGIELYPYDAELLAVRGSLYLVQADYSSALRDLEASLRIRPNAPSTLVNRAQVYRQFGRIAEAVTDLDRAIELDPESIPALFNRGSIRFSSGEYPAALADFDQCIAIDPHQAAPYFNRAASYDAMGRRDEAIADLQRFVELSDNQEWKETAHQLMQQWADTEAPAAEPAAAAGNEAP